VVRPAFDFSGDWIFRVPSPSGLRPFCHQQYPVTNLLTTWYSCATKGRVVRSPQARGWLSRARLTTAPIIREIATPRGSMAPAPGLASGLSIVSAIAQPSTQPSDILSGTTSPSQKAEQKPNRERLRLETVVTQTKQRLALRSNREKEALFPNPIDPPSATRQNAPASPRRPPANSKNENTLPSFMFRLKGTPILCFLQFADRFNRTMFRLKRTKIENAAPRAGLPHRNIPATKNGSLQPMCYAANLGPPEFAWEKN
jgi:hypothetical protein